MSCPLWLRPKWTRRKRFKWQRVLGSILYRFSSVIENNYIRRVQNPKNGLNLDSYRSTKVIVSLTSFPARIDKAYYAIKSLMMQSYKPDHLILWLSDLQFPDHTLPDSFKDLIDLGLEIKFTPDDLRSHKKYYYVLQEQKPNEVVITFDDDIIYEKDAIRRLIVCHEKFPKAIICEYGNEIVIKNGCITPYNKWLVDTNIGVEKPTKLIMPYTGAGCLYPYGVMPEITFDKDTIMKMAFTTDDLWMKFCGLYNGLSVVKTRKAGPLLCLVKGSQEQNLGYENGVEGGNDEAINRLISKFPNSLNQLKNSEL